MRKCRHGYVRRSAYSFLAHPLFNHLDTIDTVPTLSVAHKDLYQDEGEWEFDDDVAQGCSSTVADRRFWALYASLGKFCAEVRLPHYPVIYDFLWDLPALLLQASKDLPDVSVLQEELHLLRRCPEGNTRRVFEMQNERWEFNEKPLLAKRFQMDPDETKTQLATVLDVQIELNTAKTSLFIMTREHNSVLIDYWSCVVLLALRDDDPKRALWAHKALCSTIGSAVNEVVDRQSTVVDKIGRAVFRALLQLSVPLEGPCRNCRYRCSWFT